MDSNPYRPPLTQVRDMPESETDPDGIALLGSGQKLAIYAICTFVGTIIVRVLLMLLFKSSLEDDDVFLIRLFAGAAFLVAFVLSLVGQLRMTDGLGVSTGLRVVLVILVFIPLVNIIMLLTVSARTTRVLRQAGYQVGLFGAPALPS